MTVKVLSENTSCDEDIVSEHGLSLFIETNGTKFIFDTGKSDNFAKNAEKMSVCLDDAEFAVLSHGHYDHGGGIAKFIECNSHAPIYMSQYAFEPHYHEPTKYIGLNTDLASSKRIHYIDKTSYIKDNICVHIMTKENLIEPIKPYGLNTIRDGRLTEEDFRHEIYLTVKEGSRTILFSGCSHRGIINIVNYFKPDILVGGFHFMQLHSDNDKDIEELDRNIDILSKYHTKYWTCHCTGTDNYEYLKSKMGTQIEYLSAGMTADLTPVLCDK